MVLKKYSILFIVTVAMSCSDFTDIGSPKNAVEGKLVFTSNDNATSAVSAIYSLFNSSALVTGNTTLYLGLSADELLPVVQESEDLQLSTNNVSPINSKAKSLWSTAYKVIYQANACIEGLASSTGVSPEIKAALQVEAKFLRAYCYFYLVNLYGDIPLFSGIDWQAYSVLPRSPTAETYALIIKDLIEAESSLPENYPSGMQLRATKVAATALLARVYLYQEKWTEAEAQASRVIGDLPIPLPTLDNVFLISSEEALWQLQPPSYYNNSSDYSIMSGWGFSYYYVTDELLNDFEPGDQRKEAWLFPMNELHYIPYKYKADNFAPSSEYTVMLRVAEQYLIRAEARANLGQVQEAVNDLNVIRTRAGLQELPLEMSKAECLEAVEHERRIELFAEWGHRWLDLNRIQSTTTNDKTRADEVLGSIKGEGWQSTDKLYPIPDSDRRKNKNLTQNSGY